MNAAEISDLSLLPLHSLHERLGARFAPFAGYAMPVQYEGVLAEHSWTRAHAGLFDVSHMGPAFLALDPALGLSGEAAHRAVSAIVEELTPSDIASLAPGRLRYTHLLNEAGGVLDDWIVGRHPDPAASGALYLVVNAACKDADFAIIERAAAGRARLERPPGLSLLALQGPEAEGVIAALAPEVAALPFMGVWTGTLFGGPATISRTGYTGEDGFEILLGAQAQAFAEALLAEPRVKPIGLGARDSLRLEAGLCLYGHDLDATTSPVEAGLSWIVQKRRRAAADFPGADRILREIAEGPARLRVGLRPYDRAPAREGVEIAVGPEVVGRVTSGGFSPTLNAPISMGYVAAPFATPGTRVDLIVRGQPRPAEITPLPFLPPRTKRSAP